MSYYHVKNFPPKVYDYPHSRPCDTPIDPFIFNDICIDLKWTMKALREADDMDQMTAEKGEQLRQYLHDMVGDVQRLLWCLEPHIQRIATPEAIAFEKFGSDTMDVVVEYTIMDSQFLYNEAVVLEQLKAIYPEEKIRGIDGGFIVPAKPEDIKVLEVLEWAKKVRLA